MKKISSLLVFGLALLLSCEKEGPTTVNEITDLYTAPAGVKVMTFTSGESTWSTDRRYFDLKFSDLSTTLVGYDALLSPGQYLLGGDEIGKAIAAKTKVGGQTPSEGWLTVNNRNGKYQITAQFGDQVYFWAGDLPFEADPAPTVLSEVLSAQNNMANGVKSVTMQLATPGISQEFDMNTFQNVWTGEGGYLALDLYSEDGYLHDGTYTASAEGGVINAGQFGIGYDTVIEYTDWSGQPATYEAKDWGSCWWDVKDGAATATKITDGLVSVTSREESVDGKDVTIWTISWGVNYPVEVLFEGAIPTLTKPKKPAGPVVPDYLYTETITTSGEGVENHAFDITDKEDNLRAHIELLMAAGETDYEGSYPSTSYSSQPGQMVDGWVWGEYGGGSYWINDAGEKVLLAAGQYTVTVTKIAEGAYNFTCELFSYNAAGPDYVPAGDAGDDDVIVLTKFANKTDYAMFGMNMLALEFCTDGLTPTAGWFGATYEGEGNYLKLEIYAEGGALAPGTYVPNEIGSDAVDAGQFKGGYDPEGAKDYGTNWFTVAGGAATSAHITDGTVTVTQDGDNYTIVVESTAVKCKYVGPLE